MKQCLEDLTIKQEALAAGQAIKAARLLDRQPTVANPVVVSKQVENHLYRKRKHLIDLLIGTAVWIKKNHNSTPIYCKAIGPGG